MSIIIIIIIIRLHTVIGFQVFLTNINNLHTIIRFHVFQAIIQYQLTNNNNNNNNNNNQLKQLLSMVSRYMVSSISKQTYLRDRWDPILLNYFTHNEGFLVFFSSMAFVWSKCRTSLAEISARLAESRFCAYIHYDVGNTKPFKHSVIGVENTSTALSA